MDHTQDGIELDATNSSINVSRSFDREFISAETNASIKTCILECYDDEQIKEGNEIIDLPSKPECINHLTSSKKISDSIQNIQGVPVLGESCNSKGTESEHFSMILQKPHKIEDTIISAEIEHNGTKSCNEGYIDMQITDDIKDEQDEDFPSPLRPLSPQSQLRDLCKRGDADHLEEFLADICDSKDVQDYTDSQTEDNKKNQCTKKIDKSKVSKKFSTENFFCY